MKATRTVYCYYFPEVRKIINEATAKFPHETFLKSISPGLDDFHKPVMQKFMNFHSKQLSLLNEFPNQYFTCGASEAIFHLLVQIKAKNPGLKVYTLKGEYEGYKEYASRIGIKITEVEENSDFSKLEKGIWFISNPSARNGNIIPNEFISKICKFHKVILDATYVGLTKEFSFDLSNKNIIAVISSLSKPFGLYYYRIGFAFSRKPIETLEANIWFKNILSLIIADKIFDTLRPQQLYLKYRPMQEKIIAQINKEDALDLKPSDVFLLANTKTRKETIEKFKRRDNYRLCLTPYFLEGENARP